MKKNFLWILLYALLAGNGLAQAADMVNTVCPVMPDHKAKADRVVEYHDKTYGFCCKQCMKKFKADPEKYIARMAASGKCEGATCQ